MQNKHQFFFLFGNPNIRGGGGGQAGWAKFPTFTENLFWELPLVGASDFILPPADHWPSAFIISIIFLCLRFFISAMFLKSQLYLRRMKIRESSKECAAWPALGFLSAFRCNSGSICKWPSAFIIFVKSSYSWGFSFLYCSWSLICICAGWKSERGIPIGAAPNFTGDQIRTKTF